MVALEEVAEGVDRDSSETGCSVDDVTGKLLPSTTNCNDI